MILPRTIKNSTSFPRNLNLENKNPAALEQKIFVTVTIDATKMLLIYARPTGISLITLLKLSRIQLDENSLNSTLIISMFGLKDPTIIHIKGAIIKKLPIIRIK
jgi:hypothetical protein